MSTDMSTADRPLAVVTGASSGIGYELARCCAQNGFDLLIASDEPQIEEAANQLRLLGAQVEALQVDLGTAQGVDQLVRAASGSDVGALLANAGHGLGDSFMEQDFTKVRHVIDTNIIGTIDLIHRIGGRMQARRKGRILITGSIAGFLPGAYQAVYNATKAFIDSFSFALRNELKDSGVTVTCLMPGPTETNFFARAGMLDTKVGTQRKDDPASVAQVGFYAMMKGEGDVVAGLKHKLQAALANVTPSALLAEQHRHLAQPGTANG
jgi:short-subunit dehydrogenase